MKPSEKAENNVDARMIIDEVLKAVGMNAPTFAGKIGINYQRIFDLQRGRTKKFNPGVANLICDAFPQISKTFLFTGEGPVVIPVEETTAKPVDEHTDVIAMLHKVISLFEQVTEKENALQEKITQLQHREQELMKKEVELIKRESEIEAKELALGIKKD
ncbi:MAG: hypothetical protein IKW46_01680 [Bacteroidaceae bacterium]|nr:hypothetical protein [Bacteroidaceae bacterium]